ncbi:hypothetical protein ACJMK2_038262 [Sinanodonta woodiana]|uniref:Uncharacterized protein n=1 Tax=Sinanodonta woodiana TaxID=1069815 RepID=A0ABD3W9B1_SINWO
MPANNEEEAESSDSESDEINSEQYGNDEVLVNKQCVDCWILLNRMDKCTSHPSLAHGNYRFFTKIAE